MNRPQFERLVEEALDNLPPFFQEKLDNVAVVVEDQASTEVLLQQELRHPLDILGLYHGIPLTRRGMGYNFTLPDRISIYQKAIELRAATPSEIRALVAEVVEHEIGHHFGLSDEELAQAMGEE
jgi:predicted Zn-dependent protease with MMP-like domain